MHRVTADPSTLEACGAGSGLCALFRGVAEGARAEGTGSGRQLAGWGSAGRDPRSESVSERTGREQRPSAGLRRPRHPGTETPQVASPRGTRPPSITQSGLSPQSSRRGGRRSACTLQPQAGRVQGPPATAGGRAPPREGTAVRPRRARQPRDPIPSQPARTPAGPHPASVGSVGRLHTPAASDGLGCPQPPEVGRCWRHMAPARTPARCVTAQPPEAGSSDVRRGAGRGYGRGPKSFNGCGGPGLRAECRVLPVHIGAHVARASAALPSADQCASREAPLAPGVPTT